MENPDPKLILYPGRKGRPDFALRVEGGTVWLTQLEVAELFQTSKQNGSLHILNILKERELDEHSVVKESLTTASDGKMADPFQRDKSTISRHIQNVSEENELDRLATVAFLATVQTKGAREVTRDLNHFNLGVVISVGYRVKSHRGQFDPLPCP